MHFDFKIGGVDWYEKGAAMLVDAQAAGGGWNSRADDYVGTALTRGRGSAVTTAFAVLFLRRMFQKQGGPITPRVVTLAAVGPKSKPADVEACAAELVRRGKSAMPDVLLALRSEFEPRRQAAAMALASIARTMTFARLVLRKYRHSISSHLLSSASFDHSRMSSALESRRDFSWTSRFCDNADC